MIRSPESLRRGEGSEFGAPEEREVSQALKEEKKTSIFFFFPTSLCLSQYMFLLNKNLLTNLVILKLGSGLGKIFLLLTLILVI